LSIWRRRDRLDLRDCNRWSNSSWRQPFQNKAINEHWKSND